ncbi:hypothetical protein FRB94_008696 [Tulasnella sp. JGI-2019a]|nr:hypothetical protein FRB93_008497 [Tulasnella sp. JGI-2019a]KAG8995933.1 hypothetical protein FRB94_008696 [Tulasnella sp. JGI-2019a]KAG9026494.1 hypothetical protein FRB95_008807 [Tulasnella sp. JGI-2019a]
MGTTRLYCKGRLLSFRRGLRNTKPHTTLVQVEGCTTKKDAQFYIGKRVAYVYKTRSEKRGSNLRVIWGKINADHGNSGIVRAKFCPNIPSQAFGKPVRIMLYPSSI